MVQLRSLTQRCFTPQFQAEGAEGHSSSIVDLFDSLRSPIDFLQDLEWEDEYQDARFFTALSKVLFLAIESPDIAN